jgi:hypothetical protein
MKQKIFKKKEFKNEKQKNDKKFDSRNTKNIENSKKKTPMFFL